MGKNNFNNYKTTKINENNDDIIDKSEEMNTSEDTNIAENKDVIEINENNDDVNIIDEKYIVVYPFLDLEDSKYEYRVNKIYPREDMPQEMKIEALSKKRLTQLTTCNNKIGRTLIVKKNN